MITIRITTEGHVYITVGSRQLFIEQHSPLLANRSFLRLLRLGHLSATGGAGEWTYPETSIAIYAFIELGTLVRAMYDEHTIVPTGVSTTQQIVRTSVLA